MAMDRRDFLKRAGLVGGAAAAATALPGCRQLFHHLGPGSAFTGRGMLDLPATESEIDHVVVVMMENRSFDHWLGWLAEDHRFLAAGHSRYGGRFGIDGRQHQVIQGPTGPVATAHLVGAADEPSPFQGCGHVDPGHGWDEGRAQRDGGFLSPGSDNDVFATGYYVGDDLPFTSQLARRFTTFDRYHASVLGPTYPNREYLHSAQSGGNKTNAFPPAGGFTWDTIWDRLRGAGVPARYYYSDLPFLAFWGPRLSDLMHPSADYFADCAAGTLPAVSMLDPRFLGPEQCDDHPLADIRRGQAFLRDAFKAFAASPNWHKGLFVITYDEWGGFFDHVRPPRVVDDRASAVDEEDFGQTGFRVPTVLASPFARPGFVDHRTYEHSSVLRFLEWRFLGAPPEGPGRPGDSWFLTGRDRNANNLGASLSARRCSDDLGFDPNVFVAPGAPACTTGGDGGVLSTQAASAAVTGGADAPTSSMQDAAEAGVFDRMGVPVGH
ncbi:MAG TPA: alkaline phosphatase family protein [Acidimicrobiia bacterium]|jgi:phospholipase C